MTLKIKYQIPYVFCIQSILLLSLSFCNPYVNVPRLLRCVFLDMLELSWPAQLIQTSGDNGERAMKQISQEYIQPSSTPPYRHPYSLESRSTSQRLKIQIRMWVISLRKANNARVQY